MIKIEDFDIVLFSSDSFIGRLIKFGTKSKWTHVGIVVCVNDDGTCIIAEAIDKGFVASVYGTKDIIENCKIGSWKNKITEKEKTKMRLDLISMLGRDYDYLRILKIAWNIIVLRYIKRVDEDTITDYMKKDDTPKEYICSEGISRFTAKNGVRLVYKPHEYVDPGDISESKKIKWRK